MSSCRATNAKRIVAYYVRQGTERGKGVGSHRKGMKIAKVTACRHNAEESFSRTKITMTRGARARGVTSEPA